MLAHRIRWRIFAFLFGFGCMAYLQQKSLTVAAARMMPELGLSQMQIGWLEWAFVLGYAAFQLPGGVIGQRVGARRMFVAISSVAFLATVLTPVAPAALGGGALFATLLALQLALGLSQGPIFPVSSGVMEAWFRPERWALLQGLQSMGLQIAAGLQSIPRSAQRSLTSSAQTSLRRRNRRFRGDDWRASSATVRFCF
jgi:ACS family glucarate transporter-like MFS transporter